MCSYNDDRIRDLTDQLPAPESKDRTDLDSAGWIECSILGTAIYLWSLDW